MIVTSKLLEQRINERRVLPRINSSWAGKYSTASEKRLV
jgi:hypothetical protein